MLPKKCLVEAGKYFLRKQKWSEGASEEELIDIGIRSMGLNELKPFDPKEKIIEFKMESASKKSLVKMDLRQFCNETLSDSPAPGGGSVGRLDGRPGRFAWRNGRQKIFPLGRSVAGGQTPIFLAMGDKKAQS